MRDQRLWLQHRAGPWHDADHHLFFGQLARHADHRAFKHVRVGLDPGLDFGRGARDCAPSVWVSDTDTSVAPMMTAPLSSTNSG